MIILLALCSNFCDVEEFVPDGGVLGGRSPSVLPSPPWDRGPRGSAAPVSSCDPRACRGVVCKVRN